MNIPPDSQVPLMGTGIGWRPQLARAIEQRPGIGFVEIVAEDFFSPTGITVPPVLRHLQDRGIRIIPHGIGLSLGGADAIDPQRVQRLNELARELQSPLVSEHIAFVRSGNVEAGHLLPVPRTKASLQVLVENGRRAQDLLDVPLALENISTLFDWPEAKIPEAEFITELLEAADVLLLLDVANVHANARNLGGEPVTFIEQLPLQRLAYVHMGGGMEEDGIYHDTHAHAIPKGAFELLAELCSRMEPPGVMLERDDNFPTIAELTRELDAIEAAVKVGAQPAAEQPVSVQAMRRTVCMEMNESSRRELAARQRRLVNSLVGQAPLPEEFDGERLRVASRALFRKRMRAVAKVWPPLATVAGVSFAEEFPRYARLHPLPAGGAAEDGPAFASYLASRKLLPLKLRWRFFIRRILAG